MRKFYVIVFISILSLAGAKADEHLCNGETMSIEYDYKDTYCFWIDDYYTGDLIEPSKVDIILSENKKKIVITNNGTKGTLRVHLRNSCEGEHWYKWITLYEKDENLIVALPSGYTQGEELVYAGGEKITFQVRPENDQDMIFEYSEGYIGSYTRGCAYYSASSCSYSDADYNIDITMIGFTDQGNSVNLKFKPVNIPCQDPLIIPIYTIKHPQTPSGPSEVNAETQEYTYTIPNYDSKATDYVWKIEPSTAGKIVSEADNWAKIEWYAKYKQTAYLKVASKSETGTGIYSQAKEVHIMGKPNDINIYGPKEVCYSIGTNTFVYTCTNAYKIQWSISGTGATIKEDPNSEWRAIVTINSSTNNFTVKAQPTQEGNPGSITEYYVSVKESGIDIDFSNANTCSGQGLISVTGIFPSGGQAWVQNYKRETKKIAVKNLQIKNDAEALRCYYDEVNAVGKYSTTTWDNYLKFDLSDWPLDAPLRKAYLVLRINSSGGYNGEKIVFGIQGNTINLGYVASEWIDGKSSGYNVADYNESTDPNVLKINITHLMDKLRQNPVSGIYLSYRESDKTFLIHNLHSYNADYKPFIEMEYYLNSNKINTNASIGTSYSVLYEITSGGCKAAETQSIVIKQKPTVNFIAPSYCLEELPGTLTGGSADMAGSGIYLGDNVIDNEAFHANDPGNYDVIYKFTANNGCTSQNNKDVIVFNPPAFGIISVDAICGGNQISASVPNPSNYTSINWTLDGKNISAGSISFTPDKSFSGYKHIEVDVTDMNGCSNTIEKDIEIFETPTLSLNDISKCQNTTIKYYPDVVGISDGSNLSYQWTTGATTDHINVFVQSTQQIGLTVSSQSGCSTSDNMTIIMLNSPSVSVNDDEICFGEQTKLTATPYIPSWFYQWSNGQRGNEVTFNPTKVGINEYTIWVTDDNGCMNFATSEVLVNDLPLFSLANKDACYGVETTISAAPGFRNYIWNTGVSGTSMISITPSSTQMISCEVEDYNGCKNSSNMTLTVHTPVPLNLENVNACMNDKVTLEGPLGFDYYRWSNGVEFRTTDVIADQNRNYTLDVLDFHGCENSATMTLFTNPYPIVDISDQGVNEGEEKTIYAPSGYSKYLWSTGHIDDHIVVSPEEDTEYWVRISTEVGCACADTFMVKIFDIPEIIIEDKNICLGETVEIAAPEGFVTYNWTTSEETYEGRVISVSPEITTVYNLEVTTATGGVGGTSVVVNVFAIPAINAEDDLICFGESKTITTLDGYYSYLWSTGSTINTITVSPIQTTTYGLTVTTDIGCTNEAGIKITVDNPTTDFTASQTNIRPADPVQFVINSIDPTYSYKWIFGDNTNGTGSDIIHYYYDPGVFDVSLEVESANKCSAVTLKEDYINVDENNDPGLPVKEVEFSKLGVKLYPNPTSDILYIDASKYLIQDKNDIQISLYNSSGSLILKSNIKPGTLNELSLGQIKPGVYIINIEVNGIIASEKIIKVE